MEETQDSIFVQDEVTTKLGCVVAVRVVGLFASEPSFEVVPASPQVAGTPIGALKSVSIIDCPFTVEEDGEISACFFQPLLDRWKRAKRNDQDTSIEFCKLGLAVAQLCDMLSAGYSAKMTEKDQQDVSAFEDFAEGDLFTFSGCEGEGGSRGV